MKPLRILLAGICLLAIAGSSTAQVAKAREYTRSFLTYPYGDPNPVPRHGKIYPYYRFDGYSTQGVQKEWKIVELENDWIRVLVAPEMGGKILGGIEKSTGQEFIYLNKVVKFRDIAMRGAWTSGGIEFNFGSIGHAPTTASPVDYLVRTNPDGSVSCFVGAMDLTSRTEWRVEIRLPADKAWVETNLFWHNPMDLPTSKYHWATAAADAAPDLTYYFPGDHYIGHDGEASPWPILKDGRDISQYAANDYGSDHSYHVLGTYTDFFAGYYASRNFGFGHWNDYPEKPGKKIWIWALSPQGSIWTDLLTDQPGNMQYTEIQTGLLFNQEAAGSTYTPFKHMSFPGNSCERFSECWFPVVGTGGVTEITPAGILYVNEGIAGQESGSLPGETRLCALEKLQDTLIIGYQSHPTLTIPVRLSPMEVLSHKSESGLIPTSVRLASGKLKWSVSDRQARNSDRPVFSPPFDWNSVQGLYLKAVEFSRQREYSQARDHYRKCLARDPHYIPALRGLAEEYIRILKPGLAEELLMTALSYDTYDPGSNYLLATILKTKGEYYPAREAYGLALRSMEYRSAAYTGMAGISLANREFAQVFKYAQLAKDYNRYNIPAMQIEAVALRLNGDVAGATAILEELEGIDPLNHFAAFERFLLNPLEERLKDFAAGIRNEFPDQTRLELAIFYHHYGLHGDAMRVLEGAPENAEIDYWKAYLRGIISPSDYDPAPAISRPTKFVMPYRPESIRVIEKAESVRPAWQNRYYLALIRLHADDSVKARELFRSCGNEPRESHFYLKRAQLFSQADSRLALEDLLRARDLEPGEWRTWHSLSEYYTTARDWTRALDIARRGAAAVPGHMILGFDLAKAELRARNYAKCIDILGGLTILPAEGAREGHEVYRAAHLLHALDYIRQRKYLKALETVGKAREWPAGLGVGRPYETDERIEDYLTAICYLQLNQADKAAEMFTKVTDYQATRKATYDSPMLLAALSLKLMSREEEGDTLLTGWMKEQPSSPLMLWSVATYTGNSQAAAKALQRMGWLPEEIPWGLGDGQLGIVFEVSKLTIGR